MDIIEAAIIIAITLALNGTLTLLLLKAILIKMNLQPILRLAKQAASMMGTQSQVVQHGAKLKATQKIAKEKAMKGAVDFLPGGGILRAILEKSGLTGEEMFALMQDTDFLKGVKVIIDTFGGIGGAIKDKIQGGEKQQEVNQGW